MSISTSVVILGATGAVGNHVAQALSTRQEIVRLSLLGRRKATNIVGDSVSQDAVDILDPSSFDGLLEGHSAAICTLGVGQPSKMSKEDFLRIDRDAVVSFARLCKKSGVRHFELLSSVGVNPDSRSFYLRSKGELETALKSLSFERLSLFHPSMILTPSNRYGVSQAIALAVTPIVSPLLMGGLQRFRGIPAHTLGRAIAMNILTEGQGIEILEWSDFIALSKEHDERDA